MRKLWMTLVVAALAVPAMAALTEGEFVDSANGDIVIGATIGRYANVDAVDMTIAFPTDTEDNDDINDAKAEGVFSSQADDFGGTTVEDGEAYLKLSSNIRLVINVDGGMSLQGADYGDVLATTWDVLLKGQMKVDPATDWDASDGYDTKGGLPTVATDVETLATDDPRTTTDETEDIDIHVNKATVAAGGNAELWLRANATRNGLADAADVYSNGTAPLTITLFDAAPNGLVPVEE